jgi:hypothetical protein
VTITVTWQTVVTAGAVLAAVLAIVAYFAKAVRWVDKQRQQDEEIRGIKEEQKIITYGVLACLKGLHEQGSNGPVTDAIDKIEKQLNQAADA